MKINVLDKGYIRLVDSMGNDLSVVRSARVSYDAAWRTGDDAGKDEKLIKYLMAHRHTGPFEAVTCTFEVLIPITLVRQWHRHRTWSYNEVSGCYSTLDHGTYVPPSEVIGVQDSENKQIRQVDGIHSHVTDWAAKAMKIHAEETDKLYRLMLEKGIPREVARGVLPLNTYTKMFATANLHNIFHFLRLRLAKGNQQEIIWYAEALLQLIRPIAPISVQAFEDSCGRLPLVRHQLGGQSHENSCRGDGQALLANARERSPTGSGEKGIALEHLVQSFEDSL